MTKHPDLADAGVPVLFPQHQEMLTASAISESVQVARGYTSVSTRVELRRVGFSEAQSHGAPALTFPIWKPCGDIGLYQMRPDRPRALPDGHLAKYEMPKGERLCLDVPPTIRQHIGNPNIPLFLTEGIKKADALASVNACVVALLGVTCWRGTNEHGGRVALPEWNDIALNGRDIYIVFDSDVMRKLAVYKALRNVRDYLQHREANIYLIYLPTGENGTKIGVDDFLASGKTLDDLMRLATSELLPPPHEEEPPPTIPYKSTNEGLIWSRVAQGPFGDRVDDVPLTNFTARIVSEISEDDGTETTRLYQIEAQRGTRHACFSIPSGTFDVLSWAPEHLGAGAIVYPGPILKSHAAAAIRLLSEDPPEHKVYTHTGWRRLEGGQWAYLHAGGAIGAGDDAHIAVRLSAALQNYSLPTPPQGEERKNAIRACFTLRDVAPERVTFPLIAAVFRSALRTADFALSLVGPSGTFKSELASLMQRFYGQHMDANNLPGSWSSTPNALEELAYRVKDALLVIDDFAPTGSPMDVQRLHASADRVLRAQGNGSGRQRMRKDGTLLQARPPRGLICSTGEDVPAGKSLKARQFIIEVSPSDVKRDVLTRCQETASSGLYAQCLAGFVEWLAPHYDQMLAEHPAALKRLRDKSSDDTLHLRTPETVAELCIGFDWFLKYAQDAGVILEREIPEWQELCWKNLMQVARAQAVHQIASDPVQRFLDLIRAALASGRAHISHPKGFHPENKRAWGWTLRIVGVGEMERNEWHARGENIGWVDGEALYLQKDVAYNLTKRLGNESGDGIVLQPTQLWKRMAEAKLLVSTDTKRQTLTIRKTMEGKPQQVLHLHASTIVELISDAQNDCDETPSDAE